MSELFVEAFVYLLAAVVAVPVARRLGLGSVLGYLIAGVIIGPFVLGAVTTEGEDVLHFAEFGVVMMLFVIGLELQPEKLWRLRLPILGMGGTQVFATAVLIAAATLAFGFSWRVAVAVGLILALSSTAIVLQTFQEKDLMRTEAGQNGFSVLLFQDIAVIPIIALLPLLAVSGIAEGDGHADETLVSGLPAWGQALAVLAAIAAVLFGGRYLLRPIFRFIAGAGVREVFTAAALLIVVGIALLMTEVGLSPALGAFVAGVVLADSEYRHELEGDIEPFKGLLLGLFFISVGAQIDFDVIGGTPLEIAGVVVGLVLLKIAVLWAIGYRFGMGFDQRAIFAFSLAQGGEFAFVLLSLSEQEGVLESGVTDPLVGAVAISMAITPLLLLVAEHLILPRYGTRTEERREPDAVDVRNRVIMAGFGRFGNYVGRLLRANGVGVTVLDSNPDHIEVLRKLGIKSFYGDATRVDLLGAAGAEEAELIVLSMGDVDTQIELVEKIRAHFPQLTILARARGRREATRLLNAGVEHVYRETMDSGLALGTDALALLGFRKHQAMRSARTFRYHDEFHLRDMAEMAGDDHLPPISEARARLALLEQTLQADREDAQGAERDAGWDTESLREDASARARRDDPE